MENSRFNFHYYDKVIPASRIDVFKWLITGGRFGRLYFVKRVTVTTMPPDHVNCRCGTKVGDL